MCVFLFFETHLQTKRRQNIHTHKALQPEHAAAGLLRIVSYSQGDTCYPNAVCAVIQNQLCIIVLQQVH